MTYEQGRAVGARHGLWLWQRKWWIASLITVGLALLVGPTIYAILTTRPVRFTHIEHVPHHKIAIVFGAGVEPDGTPTTYLQKRLETAARLYKAGTVETLLLSGDNSTTHHNEPVAMRTYAEKLGVPRDHIVLDYGGFNTYDSCYRAHAIFGVNEAVLVSHAYHLPRAIFTCDHVGVKSVGLAAENAGQVGQDFSVNYLLRELVSTDKAFFQIVFKPRPTVLGEPELIK